MDLNSSQSSRTSRSRCTAGKTSQLLTHLVRCFNNIRLRLAFCWHYADMDTSQSDRVAAGHMSHSTAHEMSPDGNQYTYIRKDLIFLLI